MSRYINDHDAIYELKRAFPADDFGKIIRCISRTPTADVHERNVGKWEKKWHSYFKQELPCCSVCGHFSAMRWKYCPNCGAKMDGKETANEKD